jgi:hypothetical protein
MITGIGTPINQSNSPLAIATLLVSLVRANARPVAMFRA